MLQSAAAWSTKPFQTLFPLRFNKIHKFKPKVEIFVEVGPFQLKTVKDTGELKEVFALRYEVFHKEMMGKTKASGLDVDEFDVLCDHLVIREKRTQAIVGTYRLNCSLFSDQFYSGNEFHLKQILKAQGTKIELGRACIHKDYRRGVVISLLWRGIAEYMAATQAQILFGCASVKTSSPREAALLYKYFEEKKLLNPSFFAPPTLKYTMPNLSLWIQNHKAPLTDEEIKEVEVILPPLFRTYLKIGATVTGEPAWDAEFKCIDFLTILNREDLNKVLWKKYRMGSEEA
ncbi:MAG: GNAT family N-acetyltransferase [Pseudobdellovibrionaceae bacterium]